MKTVILEFRFLGKLSKTVPMSEPQLYEVSWGKQLKNSTKVEDLAHLRVCQDSVHRHIQGQGPRPCSEYTALDPS